MYSEYFSDWVKPDISELPRAMPYYARITVDLKKKKEKKELQSDIANLTPNLAVQLWASYFFFLCFSFLFRKIRIVIVSLPNKVAV